MKQLLFYLLTALIVTGNYAQQHIEKKMTNNATTPVAFLGMYHFDNPNQDQFNIQSDSIFSTKKQREIEALVRQLAKFKPTHIALEFNKNDSALEKRYQQYLEGNYQLAASEREQIGFRLARLLGHRHIYPVDEPSIQLNFNPGELATDYGHLLEALTKTGNKIVGNINSWVATKPVGTALSLLNSPELDKLNVDLYYHYLLPIGKGNVQPGLEAVTNWYKRNLFILKNIKEMISADSAEKRVLVIFGQGHTAMLKQFLQFSTEFEVVDIQPFLPKK
jgi:hypothetical protein